MHDVLPTAESYTLSLHDALPILLVAWSGGKDSALALREIRGDGRYRVAALLTTVTAEYDRISMHGVRRALLRRQAESLGLPLERSEERRVGKECRRRWRRRHETKNTKTANTAPRERR